jgi:AAA domain
LAFSSTQRAVLKVILQGRPGTGKTKTNAQLLSLVYHETPLHSANKRRTKAREPRLRTLVCAASNAGVDEVLRKLVSKGVMTLNFESITGCEGDIGSPTYFNRAISKMLEKNLRKEVDVQSLFKKAEIRGQTIHAHDLDSTYSDLNWFALGTPKIAIYVLICFLHG